MTFGVTMLSMGILGEYLWRMFDATRNRPADATKYFFETMEIAGAIALAIFAVDTIFKGRVNVHTKCTGNTRF